MIRIDSESDQITVYQPNNGKGVVMANRPPSPPTDKAAFLQFSYSNPPQSYWKKYDLAAKFVRMVRSRTPKITLHVDDAKCILYDTSPDFEAQFLRSGTKLHVAGDGNVKITSTDGTCVTLNNNSSSRSTCLAPEMQEMVERAHRWHRYCLEEEVVRERRQELYRDIVQFPITIGRRNTAPGHGRDG